jgi:hypothetical protein
MSLEIDFTEKVIVILEEVDVKELFEYIQTLKDWEQYTIDVKTTLIYTDKFPEMEEDDEFYDICLN